MRWIGFVQEQRGLVNTVPSAATLTVMAIFSLSGACNAILLLTTRPRSGLFSRSDYDDTGFREVLASDVEVEEYNTGILPSH